MSKEQEQGVIDVPFDPVTEQAFLSYFVAFSTLNPFSGFRYHPFVNFVFVPHSRRDPHALFDFLHEVSHAQLQNGVLGMVLGTLQKMAAPVEHMLFQELRRVLDSWRRESTVDESVYRDLFLYGEPRTVPGFALPASLLRDFRDAMLNRSFQNRWHIFRVINERRQELASRWRLVHEGFATFFSARLPLENDDFCRSIVHRAMTALFPPLNSEEQKVFLHALKTIASQAEARMHRVTKPRSIYTKGFQLLARIRDQHGSTFVAMTAAFAASHFPYPQCPLLDAESQRFDAWLSGTTLNPCERLMQLASTPKLLRPFSEKNLKEDEIPELMGQLLKQFPGESGTNPVSFGEWQITNLWGSDLYARAFDKPPLSLAGDHVIENYRRRFSENRSEHFAHGPFFIPTILHEDGRVVQNDENVRRAFVSNFVDAYEVERTTKLLKTLALLCDLPEITSS